MFVYITIIGIKIYDANIENPDKMAHKEPSLLDFHCVQMYVRVTRFTQLPDFTLSTSGADPCQTLMYDMLHVIDPSICPPVYHDYIYSTSLPEAYMSRDM